MSTRTTPSTRTRAARPAAEPLETRQLLSGTVTGTDIDGDVWTLHLSGPGALRVINQNGANGNPIALGTPALINEIDIAGTDPTKSVLTGSVQKSATGDGRVAFSNLTELSSKAEKLSTGLGIRAINMPSFYLADTNPSVAPVAGTPKASITIPDGVDTLRLYGADTTAFFGTTSSQQLNQSGVNTNFAITLGLPQNGGTRLIFNTLTTSGQAAAASTTGTPGTPTQNSISISVAGRLDLFQANTINGNSAFPSSQFASTPFELTSPPTVPQANGGVLLISAPDPGTGVTGQIGDVRVGGNATNFSVQTNDKVSNFYVGGETNNVFLLAPNGARNIAFGRGMDNVTIQTHVTEDLTANRDAVNSTVTSERGLGHVSIGGDVVDSRFLSGYRFNNNQALSSVFTNQALPTGSPTAQTGGGFVARLAGNVTNSIFAASVESLNGSYGTPGDLRLPHASINAKVEGNIDNSTATPGAPTTAFYANMVTLQHGPITPPNIAEQPFRGPAQPTRAPGIANLNRSTAINLAGHGSTGSGTTGTGTGTGVGGSSPSGGSNGNGGSSSNGGTGTQTPTGNALASGSKLKAARAGSATPKGPLAGKK